MKISIIGTGYVGLVSGVCLALKGHEVVCVDNNEEIVDKINNSKAAIYEPYLDEYLETAVADGKLTATTDMEYAVGNTDVSIVAVGTPFNNNGIDLCFIRKVVEDLGRLIKEKEAYHVVCIKSTVVPATTDTFVRGIIESESGKKAGEFGLVMNPEFLREGEAVTDFMKPDRIVIGAYDDKSYNVFKEVYEGKFDAPIMRVSLRTAEMIKYASNSFLALLISYSNEIAAISESVGGMDVEEILGSVSLDRRLTTRFMGEIIKPEIIKYLKAGRGFGGSCFPKDVKALIEFSRQHGYSPKLLEDTIRVNERQIKRITGKLEKEIGCIEGKKIMILGLAFKPFTDDIRESPSIKLMNELSGKKARIYCADPIVTDNTIKELQSGENISYIRDYNIILKDMDAVLLMTPWPEYVQLDEDDRIKGCAGTVFFDCCRAWNKNKITEFGIKYIGIGLS
ncbi:MAG: UDP-glucose dehydrogenase family protein [Caulobacteraceae bacterium]